MGAQVFVETNRAHEVLGSAIDALNAQLDELATRTGMWIIGPREVRLRRTSVTVWPTMQPAPAVAVRMRALIGTQQEALTALEQSEQL